MKDELMAALYSQYAKGLCRYLYSLCGNHHGAGDLTAEAFYRAVRAASRYNGGQNVQAWLFQIVRLLWIDFCRRKKEVSAAYARAGQRPHGRLSKAANWCAGKKCFPSNSAPWNRNASLSHRIQL